jgi:hypothetical protein
VRVGRGADRLRPPARPDDDDRPDAAARDRPGGPGGEPVRQLRRPRRSGRRDAAPARGIALRRGGPRPVRRRRVRPARRRHLRPRDLRTRRRARDRVPLPGPRLPDDRARGGALPRADGAARGRVHALLGRPHLVVVHGQRRAGHGPAAPGRRRRAAHLRRLLLRDGARGHLRRAVPRPGGGHGARRHDGRRGVVGRRLDGARRGPHRAGGRRDRDVRRVRAAVRSRRSATRPRSWRPRTPPCARPR